MEKSGSESEKKQTFLLSRDRKEREGGDNDFGASREIEEHDMSEFYTIAPSLPLALSFSLLGAFNLNSSAALVLPPWPGQQNMALGIRTLRQQQ